MNIFTDGSSVEIQLDNLNIVTAIEDISKKLIKFTKLPLTFITTSADDNTSGAWHCLDISKNNLLQDALQFNYKKNPITGVKPYSYSLYKEEIIKTSAFIKSLLLINLLISN